jgi:hypothetical protein
LSSPGSTTGGPGSTPSSTIVGRSARNIPVLPSAPSLPLTRKHSPKLTLRE